MRNIVALAALLLMLASPASAQWRYDSEKDPMTDGRAYYATLRSINSHKLGFPHDGGTRALLMVAELSNGQKRIALQVDRGQLLCRRSDCQIRARFDDDAAQTVEMSPPSDRSYDALLVDDSAAFLERLMSAKRLRVELLFFQEGYRMFEFRTGGLRWPPRATGQ